MAHDIQRYCQICGDKIDPSKQRGTIYCKSACREAGYKKKHNFGNPNKRTASPNSVGAASELFVCVNLLMRGFDVFRAVSPATKCDLIAERNGALCRVESRTGYRLNDGKIMFPNSRLKENRHDVLAIVIPEESFIEYRPDIEEWFKSRNA